MAQPLPERPSLSHVTVIAVTMSHWHELAGAAGQVDSTGPVVGTRPVGVTFTHQFTVAPPVETAVLGVRKLMVAGV
jgi:hypothetical protein